MHNHARHLLFNFLRFWLDDLPNALGVLTQEPLLVELTQDFSRRRVFFNLLPRSEQLSFKLVDAPASVTT